MPANAELEFTATARACVGRCSISRESIDRDLRFQKTSSRSSSKPSRRTPRHGFGALFIELKTEFGILSEDQKRIQKGLRELGNACVVARSYERAMELIRSYLDPEGDFSPEGAEE